jgi:hypothetical protein
MFKALLTIINNVCCRYHDLDIILDTTDTTILNLFNDVQ